MSRARRRTVKGLVILGSLLAFLSVFAIWTERQALNTDDWVSTSGRLIQNETIRAARQRLPGRPALRKRRRRSRTRRTSSPATPRSSPAPPPAACARWPASGAEKVLETSTAQTLWEDANRSAHEQLISVLEDKGDAVSTERRQRQPQPRQPAHQPRRPGRDRPGPGRKAAARRRPDRDPPLRRAEDGAEHRGRDQGPGPGPLAPHLPRLRRRDLPHARRPLGDRALQRHRPGRRRLRGDRLPRDRRRDRRRPAGRGRQRQARGRSGLVDRAPR